jgi:hypothetical protein
MRFVGTITSTGSVTSQSLLPKNADFGGFIGKEGVFFSMKLYRDHIDIFLSELGYSEMVQRLFEKWHFSCGPPIYNHHCSPTPAASLIDPTAIPTAIAL